MMSENDDKCSLRVVIGKNHDKYDGVLYFKTINGEKGHIVLHMLESIIINTMTNELTIPISYHDFPKMIVSEIYINLITDLYEVETEWIDKEHIEISCKWNELD